MVIALASPCIASALDEGLDKIKRFLLEASAGGAEIVCFPEAYLPGLRGQDFDVMPFDQTQQDRALKVVAQWARTYAVATILGMERLTKAGRQIAAFVIDARGQIQGYQTKNQLDPTEDQRAGAIPRRCDGRRCVAPQSSSIPSTRGVIEKVSV